MRTFRHLHLCALLATSLWASQLQAAPITVDLDYTGFTTGSRTGRLYDNTFGNRNVRAGLFGFDVTGSTGTLPWDWSDRLEAFCVEIGITLSHDPVTYTMNSAADYFNDVSQVDLIGRLYTGYRDKVIDGLTSAAFQLALWEVVNETGNALDLFGGSFRTNSFGSARGQAQSWLGSLDGIVNQYSLHVLESPDSQDLLVFSPDTPTIAAPASLGLLSLGLSVLGLRFRRRR